MLLYLILLFTIIPAVELAILIKVGTIIGVTNTMLLIIFTGVLGAALARYQGFTVLNSIQNELNRGIMPSHQLIDGLMILVGGIVLLTPGFVTDALGFTLLIPWTRSLIKALVQRKMEQMIREGQVVTFGSWTGEDDSGRGPGGYDDIDIN